MLKIIISGCNGHMGQVVTRLCSEDPDIEIAAGFDINTAALSGYPVYANPSEFDGKADAIIDFSNPASLNALLSYCVTRNTPVVLCTTGYSTEQLAKIQAASEQIPIFKSANMSVGINLIADLLKKAAAVLGSGYDVEIVEKHHNRKVDAPSGTALMLADAVSSALPYGAEYVYDRHDRRQPRGKTEIGISAVRGGTIVGEHEVIFAGPDEVIEIKHTAYSREVFANGAIRAAKYLSGTTVPGMYDMNDVIRG
jgi:4-hydroxy-tetrahydrodipicolinate reductase